MDSEKDIYKQITSDNPRGHSAVIHGNGSAGNSGVGANAAVKYIPLKPPTEKEITSKKIEIGMAILSEGKVIGIAMFDSDERLSKMMADSAKRGLTVKTMNVEEAKRLMAENHQQ